MIRSRSLTVYMLVGLAFTLDTTSAFSPSTRSSAAILNCWSLDGPSPQPSSRLEKKQRQQTRLQVTTFPSASGQSGSSYDDDDNSEGQTQTENEICMPAGVQAPLVTINSPQELAEFLKQDDRLCVIKFHAAWCKSCQRFGRKFQGLANQKTDWIDASGSIVQEGPIRMGSIEFGANSGMCRTLGIKRLPTVHIFSKQRKLEDFPCGPAKFPILQEKVHQYLEQQVRDASFEQIMQQGEELMSSSQVTGVLEQMMEREAQGKLESTRTKDSRKEKKAWWNIVP